MDNEVIEQEVKYTYGYVEALSMCQGKPITVVGQAKNDIDGFNLLVDHYWLDSEQGKRYGKLWRQCCFAGRTSPLSANDLDFWITVVFRINTESQKMERVFIHKILDQLNITPEVMEKQIGDLSECYEERWLDF